MTRNCFPNCRVNNQGSPKSLCQAPMGPHLSLSLIPARFVRAMSASKFCSPEQLRCNRETRGRTTS